MRILIVVDSEIEIGRKREEKYRDLRSRQRGCRNVVARKEILTPRKVIPPLRLGDFTSANEKTFRERIFRRDERKYMQWTTVLRLRVLRSTSSSRYLPRLRGKRTLERGKVRKTTLFERNKRIAK